MQFAELRAILADPPLKLPPPPRVLLPVLLPGDYGTAPAVPDVPARPPRDAAVLILFYPGPDGAARLVLTERSKGGHRHAGQISFPGGAMDDGEGIPEAALREAGEEIGLVAAQAEVVIVGSVAPVDVRVSGFRVHPVLATALRAPALVADGREVAAIIHAPVALFMPGVPIVVETAERDGLRLRYGAYAVDEHRVWGATAMILGSLGEWLGGSRS
jgi:8-oxo-dGTP pyrophosphatase MutT (NUDIX family)